MTSAAQTTSVYRAVEVLECGVLKGNLSPGRTYELHGKTTGLPEQNVKARMENASYSSEWTPTLLQVRMENASHVSEWTSPLLQFRRLFTKALNGFEKSELDLSIAERILKLRLIEEKAKPMLEMEETYREELIKTESSEILINNEFDELECYIDKWRIAPR
ncbi:hypothetical protein AVEN_113734-1 [Araneus ventricosus]|uniref:Uncharacterized protein n=1 Tax=Araneus ventricosus TaxID=182803 RepID=A0A4Y2QU88_ARAVE|nr:hypothetical protein AVEN_113734-1 [Araneus ventricosus]